MASEWTAVMAEVKGFETELRERQPGVDAMDDHAGYAAWRKGAALKLPAGVFVWLVNSCSSAKPTASARLTTGR